MENPSYYAIIPAEVRYCNITPNAKLLYGEITALSNKHGYCYASNEYFSKLYGVSKTSITNWINELIENKFITREIIYQENSSQVKNRYLKLCHCLQEDEEAPWSKKLDHPGENILTTSPKNLDHPGQKNLTTWSKNFVHNNTLNNINNNITYNNPGDIEQNNTEITEILEEKKEKSNQIPKAPRTISAPAVKVGTQLPVKVKAKLTDMDEDTRKAVTDYCLFLIDAYSFKAIQLCNRIDEVKRKARNVSTAIQIICQYNINGGYKLCYVPGNLSKQVAESVVVSESNTSDYVRDEEGNIEEIW